MCDVKAQAYSSDQLHTAWHAILQMQAAIILHQPDNKYATRPLFSACLTTHPCMQIAGLKRSMQYGARVRAESVKSLPACLAHMYSKEGICGLYKGSLPSILKAAPSAAVTFTAYEFVLGALTAFWADREHSRKH